MRARRHWLVLGFYLLLTLGMTWPLAIRFGSAIPGDSFDGWQNYWNLWWMRVALVERVQWPLFTDLLYYPTGVSLHFHTLNPFNGLVSLPVQLSSGLIPAYNAVVLLSFTLSGYGAYLLALWVQRPHPPAPSPNRREGEVQFAVLPLSESERGPGGEVAALLAGVIFAFAPVHMAHLLGHMQVFAYQWLSFTVLYTLRALERARRGASWRREALLGGLFLALAGLCDWYFVLYLALFVGLAVIWHGVAGARRLGVAAAGRVVGAAATLGGFGALLLAPLLLPMVSEALRNDFMVRPASDLYIFRASLLDFVVPNRLHTLFRLESFDWPGNQVAPVSERTIAVGYVTLALAVVALIVGRTRRRALPWLLAAGFFVLLAMGPRLTLGDITAESIPQGAPPEFSPYTLLNRIIPFMRISRSVSRFAIMVQLCLSVAAALGLAALAGRVRRAWLPGALAIAIVLAEFWVAPYPLSPPDTPAWYGTPAAQSAGAARPALLNLPMNYDRPGYLLYQTVHGRPLTVAYISRDDPRTLTERVPVLQHLRHLGPDIIEADLAAVGPTVLADLSVGSVVLDRYKMPGGLERDYTEAVAAEIFAGQAPEYEDERITVYRAVGGGDVAYLALGAEGWGALQTGDGGLQGRRIGAAPAAVELRHGAGGERLRIRYRSETPVEVLDGRGAVLVTLPIAPEGTTQSAGFGEGDRLLLRAEGGALITNLLLE